MKRILKSTFLACSIIIATNLKAQTITSYSPRNYYAGQCYPLTMTLHGNSIFPQPNTLSVYDISLILNQSPFTEIKVVDGNDYPYSTINSIEYQDSLVIYSNSFVPHNIPVGTYDLILTKCNNTSIPPTIFYYDTLLNAVDILRPDGIAGGKTFIDRNLNKVYDGSDSVITGLRTSFTEYCSNVQYDSLNQYFYPSDNGIQKIYFSTLQNQYVLVSDSSQFSLIMNNTNQMNFDFAVTEGFYHCFPDTVNFGDTITFDFLSRGLFRPSFFERLVLVDSLYMETQMEVNTLGDSRITLIDSNEILVRFPISALPGMYSIKVENVGLDIHYNLYNSIFIKPSINDIGNKVFEKPITIFPIPAYDYIYIEGLNEKSKTRYAIFNSLGQSISSGFMEQERKIPIHGLLPGIYYIRFFSDSLIHFTTKFLVD